MGYSWVYLLWCTLPGFYGRFRFLGFASCFLGFDLPFFPSVIFGSFGRSESNVLLSGLSSVSLSEAGCRLGVKLLSDVLDFPLVPEVVRFSLFFPLVYLWNLGSGFPGCLLYPGFTVVFQFYNARAGFMLNGLLLSLSSGWYPVHGRPHYSIFRGRALASPCYAAWSILDGCDSLCVMLVFRFSLLVFLWMYRELIALNPG